VKRRSFPDSFGRFTFYVSPFTNDKAGLFERAAGLNLMVDAREHFKVGHTSMDFPQLARRP
jgi:hypothetical protein